MKEKNSLIIPDEIVLNKIYYIREQKVMLDSDLAELYGVETNGQYKSYPLARIDPAHYKIHNLITVDKVEFH